MNRTSHNASFQSNRVRQLKLTGLQKLLLALVFIVFRAGHAWACSCAYISPDGFVPSPRAGFTSPTGVLQPLHLPKNARGVLYYRSASSPVSYMREIGALLQHAPIPPKAGDFTAIDETTGQPIEVAVRKLKDPQDREPIRYFAPNDKALENCLPSGEGAKCESVRKGLYEEDFLTKLQSQGKVRDVTEEQKAATGLFRIEPKNGFTPGHAYRFTFGTTTLVTIDPEELDVSQLARVTLQSTGQMSRRLLSVQASGRCSKSVVANVQELDFALSAEAERYRESMLFFFDTTATGSAEGKEETKGWIYHSSLCSAYRYGRGEGRTGTELFYAACGGGYRSPNTASAARFKIVGRLGLLQVDDEFHKTPERSIDFPALTSDQCSPASVLEAIEMFLKTGSR